MIPPTSSTADSGASLRTALPRVLDAMRSTCRPETLTRGKAYQESGRVRVVDVGDERARAEVMGSDDAPYECVLDWSSQLPTSSCTCTAWGSWDDHCKHVAALAFALEKELRGDGATARQRQPPASLQTPAPTARPQAPEPAQLEAVRRWLGVPMVGHSFAYDVEFTTSGVAIGVSRAEKSSLGRPRFVQVAPYLTGTTIEPADRRLLGLISPLPRSPEGRYHATGAAAGPVLEAMQARLVTTEGHPVQFAEQPAHLFGELGLAEGRHSITVRLRLGDGALVALDHVRFVGSVPLFALQGTTLHKVETAAPSEQLERWQNQPTLTLGADTSTAFDLALGGLRRLGVILDAAAVTAPPPPVFVLTLDGDAEAVRAMLAVRYDDVELAVTGGGQTTHVTTDGRLLRRDAQAESGAAESMLRAGLSPGGGAFLARGDAAVEFWTRGVLTLPRDWTLFGPKPRDVVRLRSLAPRMSLSQASTGWFTLEVAFAEEDQSVDLARIRPLLASGRRYVKLSDGSVGELPRELCEHIRSVLEETGAESEDGELRLAPYEAGEVERLVELVPEARVEPETRRFLAALRDFHGIEEMEVPPGLTAELRPYQRRGLDWLAFLHRFGMSGVLADDMGLGKTVQALALMLDLKRRSGAMPSLVVAPTSVLPNWQREAERFTPDLKALVYDGPDREPLRAKFAESDLVLTSYAILRRDAEVLRETKFRYVVLDEAQHVKNPNSLGARAARALRSDHRLVLTGTPLENRLSDLWSLFNFLMPGFLGSENHFRQRYARPIEVDGNSGVRDKLKRRVHPFILRRLKDEVAKDLPPRTDAVLPVELSVGQQALYREMLMTARDRVHSFIEKFGFKKARVSILAELLRLRQVCNDPRLLKLPPGTRLPPSAKLEAFGELVRDLIEEGHRALVFSQFTEMLGHLTEWADEEGLKYEYLDGSTQNRQERIDRFNAKEGPPLFFISLKAGGTGLNLTAADYVIHYDPWWNPAVEQQATDRAHRIGQTKPVFSYKLITRGTVEEKILAMQERKRTLATQVLSEDDVLGKVLSEADIEELFTG